MQWHLPLASHVLNHNGGDTKSIGNLLGVLDLSVLDLVGLHDLVHLVTNIPQDVVQELNGTLAGTHTVDHTEVDVLATVSQVLASGQLSDLEELSKVEILLGSNNVDHLIELVGLVTLSNGANVTGQVERSAVLADNDSLSELLSTVLGEVGNDSTLRLLGDTGLLHSLQGVGHALGFDLGFTGVDVEVDVQTSVSLLVLGDTQVTEAAPESQCLGRAILHALEVTTGLLILADVNQLGKLGLFGGNILALLLLQLDLLLQGLDGAVLLANQAVHLDVNLEKVVDGVLLQRLLVTEVLETIGKQTVLLTPVTKVVHLDDIPAQNGVQVCEETTNDRTAQVTGVEGLSDVGRRELNDDLLLALGGVGGILETQVSVGTVGSLFGQDTAQDGLSQRQWLAEELNVRADGSRRVDEVGGGELGDHFFGELLRLLLDAEGSNLVVKFHKLAFDIKNRMLSQKINHVGFAYRQ